MKLPFFGRKQTMTEESLDTGVPNETEVSTGCSECNGTGLINAQTLCTNCEGSGQA